MMLDGHKALAVFVFVLFVALAVTVILGALWGTKLREKVDELNPSKVFLSRGGIVSIAPKDPALTPDSTNTVTLFQIPAVSCKVPSGYRSYFEFQAADDAKVTFAVTYSAASTDVPTKFTLCGKDVDLQAPFPAPSSSSPYTTSASLKKTTLIDCDDVVGPFAFRLTLGGKPASVTNASAGNLLWRHCIKADC